MIPYTLTKRPTPAKKKKRPLPSAKSTNAGGDSDSDGEPVSFFSHLESTNVEPEGADTHSDVPSDFHDNSSELSLDAAPSAPKPFTIGTEGGVAWEESGIFAEPYPMENDVNSGEGVVTDEHYEQPVAAPAIPTQGSMPGAGPGLSMDDQAVSTSVGLFHLT